MKKRLKNIFLFLLCTLSLWACTNKYEQMPSPVEMKIVTSAKILDYCTSICTITDSTLILMNGCGKEWFSLYNTNQLNHLSDFGTKGHLPGELMQPLIINDIEHGLRNIMIYDIGAMKMYPLTSQEMILGDSSYAILRSKSQDLPKQIISSVDLSYVGDNTIAGTSISMDPNDKLFFIYDGNSNQKKGIEFEPKYEYAESSDKLMAYANSIFANRAKRVVAVAFKHFDMINFYGADGDIIKSVKFSNIVQPQLPGAILYNNLMYGTKEYLFVGRAEATIDDIINGKLQEMKILKFDWSGNLLTVYKTNMNIGAFCVNAENNKLYTVVKSSDPEYAEIIVFDLPLDCN